MRPFYSALFVCLAGLSWSCAQAAPTWLTLVGDPQDATADYIEFDPGSLAGKKGVPTLAVRVSRARPRTSKEGIVFRSFESVVAVECRKRTAHFVQASFFAEPDFKGSAFKTVVFGPSDVRPMAFREIKGDPTRRIVRAACNTTIKSISSSAD
jgi:hypothetical protein